MTNKALLWNLHEQSLCAGLNVLLSASELALRHRFTHTHTQKSYSLLPPAQTQLSGSTTAHKAQKHSHANTKGSAIPLPQKST